MDLRPIIRALHARRERGDDEDDEDDDDDEDDRFAIEGSGDPRRDPYRNRRLHADRWELGFKTETVVSDTGHELRFAGTVVPQDTTVAAGKEINGVKYTITSVTCVAP